MGSTVRIENLIKKIERGEGFEISELNEIANVLNDDYNYLRGVAAQMHDPQGVIGISGKLIALQRLIHAMARRIR